LVERNFRKRLLKTGCGFGQCERQGAVGGTFDDAFGIQQTSVSKVFACGDVARAAGSIALAVSDGSMAGVAAHRSLIF
jgi:thioredoxin reductase